MNEISAPRDNLVRANLQREAATLDGEGRTMAGYPIVFNKWTTIDSYEGRFKEQIAPGAVTRTIRNNGSAIKVLFNHGMDPSIGNKPLGKPSVMEIDGRGLYTEVPLSDTSYNEDLKALMRDGAIDGMSFRFSVVDEQWNYPDKKNALPERTITELRLMEFGPVTFPAYEATTVGVRSVQDFESWVGVNDEQRAAIAEIVGTDLRTVSESLGAATDPGTLANPDTSGSVEGDHPAITTTDRRDALLAIAALKGVI